MNMSHSQTSPQWSTQGQRKVAFVERQPYGEVLPKQVQRKSAFS